MTNGNQDVTQNADRPAWAKALGPGFLFAAVSVGVSHLVQSTRAGAGYGFSLLPVIIIALVVKYPLFEFGQRYAVATGHSLLEGYRRQGFATLASCACIEHCLEMGLRPEWGCYYNPASGALARSLGFSERPGTEVNYVRIEAAG